jgi:hypothetical protein
MVSSRTWFAAAFVGEERSGTAGGSAAREKENAASMSAEYKMFRCMRPVSQFYCRKTSSAATFQRLPEPVR